MHMEHIIYPRGTYCVSLNNKTGIFTGQIKWFDGEISSINSDTLAEIHKWKREYLQDLR